MQDFSQPADWQLPPGVNRALWDYTHSDTLAQGYDASLVGSPLLQTDVEFLLRHCSGPAWLIDLGCGTGRLLTTLARQNWRVLGVDLSPAMLRIAANQATSAGLHVDLLQGNIVSLDALASESFDYAACLFSTLGMIIGHQARSQALAEVYRLLRPGGRLILHVHNRWFRLWDGQGRRWLITNWFCHHANGDHVMPTHQGIAGLTLHLFTKGEILSLLRQTGFHPLTIEPVAIVPPAPHWLGNIRAYGFLICAERPILPPPEQR